MKVLIFCPNWIGDVVMATPALRALRARFPDASITALLRPYVADVLAGNPCVDQTIPYDHKSKNAGERTGAILRTLRRERFDMGVLLTNSLRTAALAWLGGVKRRVGYAREGRRLFLNDALRVARPWRGYEPSPVIDYYLKLAYHLGAEPEPYHMDLYTTAEDEHRTNALWSKFGFTGADQIVVLNPGAAFGSAKRWPSESFADLAARLSERPGVKILVLCGPSERGFARFIADRSLRPRRIKSMAEENVSLGLSKAIIRRSSLLISTDSGPRHFGAAFGIPVVSLFGPTHIAWTETYYARETKLQKKVPCGPCQQRVCPLEHLRCMTELSVDDVYAAALHWLSVPKRAAG